MKKRIVCSQCGKNFFDYLSSKRVVCSMSCNRIRRKANQQVAIRCMVCYAIFFDRLCKAKIRKTCSRHCSGKMHPVSQHMYGNKLSYKGDDVTKWAQYKRANNIKRPGSCELCDSSGEVLHHKDENPSNNNPTNLQSLCRACHMNHHRERLVAGQRAMRTA